MPSPDGAKTTTLRYWRRRRVRPGSLHAVPHLGRIRVESVEQVRLADLTEQHARADGFQTLGDLQEALATIYGQDPMTDGRQLYLVRFTFLG